MIEDRDPKTKRRSFVLSQSERPDWFDYDKSYFQFIECGIEQMGPWRFLDAKTQASLASSIAARRNLQFLPVAFNRARDCETIGWLRDTDFVRLVLMTDELNHPHTIECKFDTFWHVLDYIFNDMKDWASAQK